MDLWLLKDDRIAGARVCQEHKYRQYLANTESNIREKDRHGLRGPSYLHAVERFAIIECLKFERVDQSEFGQPFGDELLDGHRRQSPGALSGSPAARDTNSFGLGRYERVDGKLPPSTHIARCSAGKYVLSFGVFAKRPEIMNATARLLELQLKVSEEIRVLIVRVHLIGETVEPAGRRQLPRAALRSDKIVVV